MVVGARCVDVCLMISFGHRSGGEGALVQLLVSGVVHLHYLRY